ncbi:MAG: DNA-directed DNA polymerase I [Candidatus Ranarchaeia archaeon]
MSKNTPSLESFVDNPEVKKVRKKEIKTPTIKENNDRVSEKRKVLWEKLQIINTPKDSDDNLLFGLDYDGKAAKVRAMLLDLKTNKISFWWDNTGHKPYLLTDIPKKEILKMDSIMNHPGFLKVEDAPLFDLLHDKEVLMTRIVAKDPLSVGGSSFRGAQSFRDLLPLDENNKSRAWEARIRYHESYVMDRKLIPGLFYKINDYSLEPKEYKISKTVIDEIMEEFKNDPKETLDNLKEFIPLLFTPIPEIPRIAIDIEIEVSEQDVIPDPTAASLPITAIGLSSNTGEKRVLVLKRKNHPEGKWDERKEIGVKIEFFESEEDMILESINTLLDYPVIVTFNGDNFDIPYIYNRLFKKFKVPRETIPFSIRDKPFGGKEALFARGAHLDIYSFLSNPSVKIYGFNHAYKENNLNAISEAILGRGKIKLSDSFDSLPYYDLAKYCYNDAEITLELTTTRNNLVVNLIFLFMRITKLSIDTVCRQSIGSWIKGLFYYEHRKRGYLINNPEEIREEKGTTETDAIIEGKKFKGGLVLDPVKGVHFDVAVLDFASLYPSIIKEYNLSWETVRCPHADCKEKDENQIPGTTHWKCDKRIGLASQIVGLIRDVRVRYFKQKSKDNNKDEKQRNWNAVVGQVLKVFINASYGVFGSENFPLFCAPMAESTTAIGRYSILQTIEEAKKEKLEVLYGDTDSVFVKKPTKEQIRSLENWAKSKLGIDLEFEKNYRWVALSDRKKNYLGVFDDGSVDVKGLLGKKRNTPLFIQVIFRMLLKILSNVKTNSDFEEATKSIKELIRSTYKKLENGEIPIEELAFRTQMTKKMDSYTKTNPQHVKAARQYKTITGKELPRGAIVSYVKVTGSAGVKPIISARVDEIDISKYKAFIKSTFSQILDSLGIDYADVSGFTTLDAFL